MPEKTTLKRAKEDLHEGKRPSTAAGEFVREEMHHIREGKHGAQSTKQAIAIGLSKARRAGVPLEPPGEGQTSESTRESAERDYEIGQGEREPRAPSRKRARATLPRSEGAWNGLVWRGEGISAFAATRLSSSYTPRPFYRVAHLVSGMKQGSTSGPFSPWARVLPCSWAATCSGRRWPKSASGAAPMTSVSP